ncbi:MAG: YraN family protein [Pseudomonadota bacterium]
MTGGRRAAERRGRRAEWAAAVLLTLKGYAVLAMRYKASGGEIDIVARRGRRLAFVEVKARQTRTAALEAVDARTRRRVEAAARAYIAARPGFAEYNQAYDIILAAGARLVHIRNAWREGD